MKKTLLSLLAIATAFSLSGCGTKQPTQTTTVKVENPPEKAAPAPKGSKTPPPMPKPAPPTPQPEAAKPKPDKSGYVTLPSGVKYKDIKVGKGTAATGGKEVTVHYTGTLDNGKVFDASRKHGKPFTFTLGVGRVIKGWDTGVEGMKVGGVRDLIIPPSQGYGDQELPGIPAGSTLHFKVELLKVGA